MPYRISVFVVCLLKGVGGDREISTPCQNLQLADSILWVGVCKFITNCQQKIVPAKVFVGYTTDIFSGFWYRTTVSSENRNVIPDF